MLWRIGEAFAQVVRGVEPKRARAFGLLQQIQRRQLLQIDVRGLRGDAVRATVTLDRVGVARAAQCVAEQRDLTVIQAARQARRAAQ